MRERNHWLLILLITVVIILLGWTFYLKERTNHTVLPIQHNNPDYKSAKMSSLVYSNMGILEYKLQSDDVKYYKKSDETTFVKPILTVFNNNAQPEWKITADHAKLSATNMIYLSGDVNLVNIDDKSQIQSVTTSEATLNLVTQDISSIAVVTILGKQFHSKGIGLKGNLKNKKATLLHEVSTYYE